MIWVPFDQLVASVYESNNFAWPQDAGERTVTTLDLHVHSSASDDSRATVEGYVNWSRLLRDSGHCIDGFVLTEHRKFDKTRDYSMIAAENEMVILSGSELDTNMGHVLVYGVSEELIKDIDFQDVTMDATQLLRRTWETGGIAIPAHPGRLGIGLYEFVCRGVTCNEIGAVEHFNGGDWPVEQERAERLVRSQGYFGTGGSDAHLVSSLGSCMTEFDDTVSDEAGLVRALRSGRFRPIRLRTTRRE